MKWREGKRRHDDAHRPLGGKGRRATSRKRKMFPGGKCTHPMITTGVVDKCSYCDEIMPKSN